MIECLVKKMEDLYFQKLETLKERFIHQYMMITYCVFISFIIIFHFFVTNSFITLYLIGGLIFISYSYFLVKGKYTADQIMHAYMIAAPLYYFYIILSFWENSIASFVTLFTLPLTAYIFFSKRIAVMYLIYMVAEIIVVFFVYKYSGFQFNKYMRDEVIFCDTLLLTFNFIVIILLLFYHDKINKLRVLSEVKSADNETKESVLAIQKNVAKKEIINEETAEELFEKLKYIMDNEKLFKSPNLDISKLSSSLGVNYAYLSRTIRYKGYSNFNNFLNMYRVNYVKELIKENDLQKITLMYIYTEAGFSSQATFNRVFKQIEGITPSEYISQIGKDAS